MSEKMIIVENGAILTDDLAIAECMNNYSVNITNTLDIKKWPEQSPFNVTLDIITKARIKYINHPSIIMIKRKTGLINKKFAFQHILPNNVSKQVKQLDTTKSTSGNIPTKII